MITLKKSDSKDFVILNITDMQMNPSDWNEGDKAGQSVVHTISTLVDRVKPDLITVTGDIANGYAEFEDSDPYNSIWNSVYRNFTDFMDSFRIPWAPVSGNHDHFFKCWKRYFALTPVQFINNLRLEAAAQRLIETNISVSEIIKEVNFEGE